MTSLPWDDPRSDPLGDVQRALAALPEWDRQPPTHRDVAR